MCGWVGGREKKSVFFVREREEEGGGDRERTRVLAMCVCACAFNDARVNVYLIISVCSCIHPQLCCVSEIILTPFDQGQEGA